MLLMIDNYDSFTYNLVQYLGELGEEVKVFRNDEITLEAVGKLGPARIVISPGPCTPNEAGISVPLIREFAGRIPILGVCLGHQAIGQALGGRIVHAKQLMHGKTSAIHHDAIRRELRDLFDRDLVVAEHAHVLAQLAEVLHEVVGERVVVVDHEQHIDRSLLFMLKLASENAL